MRLFKLLTTLLLLSVIVLFIRQNLPTFNKTLDFSLNLFIREEVHWTHRVSTIIFLSGFFGFLVGFFLMLKPYLHTRKAWHQERKEKERLLKEAASRSASEALPEPKTDQEESPESASAEGEPSPA